MKQTDSSKKERLFKELHNCIFLLRRYADMSSLIMPLVYILVAHHEGHLLSLVADDPQNIFKGKKHLQPLLDQDLNDVESPLLKRIRFSVDQRYFVGETVQIIYDFYSKNCLLIKEYYPDLIEYLFTMYSKNAGKAGGMFSTPFEVSQLMYTLALQNGVQCIYDPCAGLCTGAILPQMRNVDFIAQEINEHIELFAQIRLEAHGKQIKLYTEDTTHVWRGAEADCLCSELPMGVKMTSKNTETSRPQMLEDYIMWQFLKTSSLKRAVLLVSNSTCLRSQNFSLRKTLCEKNYIDTVIELPQGILAGTGISTTILVLDKTKSDKTIKFISAADCITKGGRIDRFLDIEKVLARISGKDKTQCAFCDNDETFKNDCSLSPAIYITDDIEVLPGQKLVKLTDIARRVRGQREHGMTEGRVLTPNFMYSSLVEFHTDNRQLPVMKFEEERPFLEVIEPCVILTLTGEKFYIKSDRVPIYVRSNTFEVFEVDTQKCSLEYFAHILINSQHLSRLRGNSFIARFSYRTVLLPFFEDKQSQQNIVARLYREAERELQAKIEKLQLLSGKSSDLLHNLGVTFTKISAAVGLLQLNQDQSQQSTVASLDDNVRFALRQINSTGTDFSQSVPVMDKFNLEQLVHDYIKSWSNFGYSSFEILPMKSSFPEAGSTLVQVDKDLFYTMLDCILINAHQHGFGKRCDETNKVSIELAPVTITDTETEKESEYALISISNNGEPLPDGFTLKDFVSRGVVGYNSSQDGIGGNHVYNIVHLFGGRVSIESDAQWLSFNLLIPIYITPNDTRFEEYECESL